MKEPEVLCSLIDVSLTYKERKFLRQSETRVLSDLNIDIRRGETLGIIGRNGAGKSTLLKIIAGVITPNEGRVELKNGITSALLTYQLGFNAALSGRENAIYSALLLGLSRQQAEAVLEQIFDFAGLEKFMDVPLAQYSAGMRARLGFSVALFAEPEMILIDEALGVGDHQFREKSTEAIKEWIQTDKTVVFVSHDEASVRSLCDRIVWLEHGNSVMTGLTDEVLDFYLSFDHFVKSLSKNKPEWSEEYIRNHPLTRDPVSVLQRMRSELKSEWEEIKTQTAEKFGGVVNTYFPTRKSQARHVVDDEDGNTYWIENTKVILEGSSATVKERFEHFQGTISAIAARTNMTMDEFRASPLYRDCLALVGSPQG